ncbi:TRAP transporter large permease [Marinivivus vitaminiproducens]|uniref:TRAP transporter large permease n=1 Tax=Marinivivus vitaminiproducens TaxID=3035935 RepID=UPI0027AB7EEC|nr:TRAP transporter large permease [Geminicoccaceae bacterium SCSIO 64248]
MIWLIILAGIVLTGLIGLPVGIGLGLTGFAILHFMAGDASALAVTAIWNVFNDFLLSAVPMFIYMGEILLVSGVSRKLYVAAAPVFRGVPGGLLHTNIAVCTIFGAVSGASTSTAAAVGSVAFPELRKRGYHGGTVVGTLAAGGTLGLLIPPSLSLLIYGATQGVSIGKLFLAGIVPGVLLALLFMMIIRVMARRDPALAPVDPVATPLGEMMTGVLRIWPVAILIFAVLGTIYFGIATPTEASSLGVVASIVIGFAWGDLTWRKVIIAFRDGTVVFATLGIVLMGAITLAQSISILGLPSQVMAGISGLDLSPYVVLLMVIGVYLILGCFFDGISLMLMTLPVVFPVLTGVGFDAVWLGVIITILIEIGMLTPPVGMNLFVLVAITRGEVDLAQAAKATLPFWIAMLLSIAVFTVFPSLVLVLPNNL